MNAKKTNVSGWRRRGCAITVFVAACVYTVTSAWAVEELVWYRKVVDRGFDYAVCAEGADVDGDGDVDIIAVSYSQDTVAWWENVNGRGSSWTKHPVDQNFDTPYSVHAADIDDDGDMDIAGAALDGRDISWWENMNGSGTLWTEHLVDGEVVYALGVYTADIDGDGDTDLVGVASEDDDIAWWENTDGSGHSWTKHLVDGDFQDGNCVHAADVDGDGDVDILGTSARDQVAWWDNLDGLGTSWTKRVIDSDFDHAVSICAADVDADSHMDVLAAALGASDIAWWRNTDGSGTSWTKQTVDGEFIGARYVCAADMDRDGDVDILGAADEDDDIAWWENADGSGTSWIKHVIDGNFIQAYSACPADVDGDGDLDVIGAAFTLTAYYDTLAWWESIPASELCVAAWPLVGLLLGAGIRVTMTGTQRR